MGYKLKVFSSKSLPNILLTILLGSNTDNKTPHTSKKGNLTDYFPTETGVLDEDNLNSHCENEMYANHCTRNKIHQVVYRKL